MLQLFHGVSVNTVSAAIINDSAVTSAFVADSSNSSIGCCGCSFSLLVVPPALWRVSKLSLPPHSTLKRFTPDPEEGSCAIGTGQGQPEPRPRPRPARAKRLARAKASQGQGQPGPGPARARASQGHGQPGPRASQGQGQPRAKASQAQGRPAKAKANQGQPRPVKDSHGQAAGVGHPKQSVSQSAHQVNQHR